MWCQLITKLETTNVQKREFASIIFMNFGISSAVITSETAKLMIVVIMGTFKHFEACALGKAKEGNLSKLPHEKSKNMERDYSLTLLL